MSTCPKKKTEVEEVKKYSPEFTRKQLAMALLWAEDNSDDACEEGECEDCEEEPEANKSYIKKADALIRALKIMELL